MKLSALSGLQKKEKKISAREQMLAKYIFDRGLILGFKLTQTTLT